MDSGLDTASQLMLQQAYYNDRMVRLVKRGQILEQGLCRVYMDTRGEIVANIKTISGAWVRGISMKHIVLVEEPDVTP